MGVTATRLLAPLALVVSPLFGTAAAAFTPSDVVAAAPESERSLRQSAAVAAAERSLDATEAGTRAALDLTPTVAYGADVEDPAAVTPSFDVGLELGWRHDAAALRRDRADLLHQRERLRHWRRADVRAGLRLLGETLRAEVALERARLDLARARRPGGAAPAVHRAEALVHARLHALQRLRGDAAAIGFRGAPRLDPVAFALPDAPARPPGAERLALALEAARIERDRATTFDVVRDLTLDAVYESRSDRFQLSASLSLDRGRPMASLGGELGGQEDDQWYLRISADVRFDSAAAAGRTDAAERVRRVEAELAALEEAYPRRLREARSGVADARAALTAELAAWREEVAPQPAGAAQPDSECRALLARENAVYGAWLDQVSAVYAYLEVVDGAWAAGPPRPPLAPRAPRIAAAAGTDSSPVAGPGTGDGAGAAWPTRPSGCASAAAGVDGG